MNDHTLVQSEFVWLNHLQPVGLVVARSVLDELGLVPARQTAADEAIVAQLLDREVSGPAIKDAWSFFRDVLGWHPEDVAGAPGGPTVPTELRRALPEHDIVLEPAWAVRGAKGEREPAWQILVRVEAHGIDPDKRGELSGWEATPHQRFERLLRETGVAAGVLLTDFARDGRKHAEMRLIHAPPGETSGWLAWPLLELASTAGRPMLGGMKLLLDAHSLFANRCETRLLHVLDASRKAQASVSTELSGQVLGALHELLRGVHAAKPAVIEALAAREPQRLYEGLLTVLMRLVFILYAEDRDLIPSKTDGNSRALYDQGYSVRGLYAKLLDNEALYPDTMDERLGGWGRLIALFRLVHTGHGSGWIKGRGGKLFDPDAFLFLEGREKHEDEPGVLHVSDGAILRILRRLMTLKGERLSYRTLDVEQIGSVYETVMGFTVEASSGRALAIKAGKGNRVPVFINLDALAARKSKDRIKALKEDYSRASVTANQKRAIEEAASATELETALSSLIDERGSPGGHPAAPSSPILQPSDERRRTGSHYTPRTLTEPIVRHALAPAFERLGETAAPEDILDLKVCDPAMGSGAFLVEACRQLAARLVKAWGVHKDKRPAIPPDEDEDLHARRLVAQRCLYGVDKNHMATDLARLSLWLATLARDHEFTFLDHALKDADSLTGLDGSVSRFPNLRSGHIYVSLTLAQICALTWKNPESGLPIARVIATQKLERAHQLRMAIRHAPEGTSAQELEERNSEYLELTNEFRQQGDAVISAFFAGRNNRERETLRREVEGWAMSRETSAAERMQKFKEQLSAGIYPIRPFHWELEFPEVFSRENPGFDAIIGNPPFAGKNTIAAGNRLGYGEWLKEIHPGAHGNADLVAHFFRRAYELIRKEGVLGLIATNTIGQGDTRATGLTTILASGGAITHAVRRLKWPGEAAVVVSVVHIIKGDARSPVLDERQVRRISAYLVEGDLDVSPKPLAANARKAFQGSIVLGMGLTFDDEAAAKGTASSLADMERLITKDPRNAERIFPYIGGEEVNNDPRHTHRRYVIDFGEMSETEARNSWPALMELVERLMKGTRASHSTAPWWLFERRRGELYRAISFLPKVLAINCGACPHMVFAMIPNAMVYANTLGIFGFSSIHALAALQSRVHEVWARFFASTLEDRLRYTPSDCFATFPFPPNFETDPVLEAAGQAYHDHRAAFMIARNEGLTKIYNRFHDPAETSADIARLRELHAAMDAAVLCAYGWDDLADDAHPAHLEESTEDDHKYQGRFFWPAPFRDEVLARLLALNAKRADEERRTGLEPFLELDETTEEAPELDEA